MEWGHAGNLYLSMALMQSDYEIKRVTATTLRAYV